MISNRMLRYDFQIVGCLPLKLCCMSKYILTTWISKKTEVVSTASMAAWHRKQTFLNPTCYQVQQWIFKSTICKLYSTWTPCAKFNILKWSLGNNSLWKISGFKVSLDLFFLSFTSSRNTVKYPIRARTWAGHRNVEEWQWDTAMTVIFIALPAEDRVGTGRLIVSLNVLT